MQEMGVIAACLAAGIYIVIKTMRSIRDRNACRCEECPVKDCESRRQALFSLDAGARDK